MAAISVPCPKCANAAVAPRLAAHPRPQAKLAAGFPALRRALDPAGRRFPVLRVQTKDVAVSIENNKPVSSISNSTDSKSDAADSSESKVEQAPMSPSVISAFMAEASRLVELVDSKDVSELKLKHAGCEIIIRKKEALEEQAPIVPPVAVQYPVLPPQFSFPQTPIPPAPAPVPTQAPMASAPAAPSAPLALPPPSMGESKSSLPPLLSPMAGNFYRSPAPGAPPFVKVGDKVRKGQILCIIEAMKLMNEIEADKSGTIVEILLEDGKPVSMNTPLFIIQP